MQPHLPFPILGLSGGMASGKSFVAKLGAVDFANPQAGGRLNGLLHPPLEALRTQRLAALMLVLGALISCSKKGSEQPPGIPLPSPAVPVQPKLGPRFRAFEITTPKELVKLQDALGEQRFAEVLKLNRIDLDHARRGDRLVVPNAPEDWLALSPFPGPWKDVEDQPKLIAVSLRLQAWAAFEQGKQVRWGPVSTGKKITPTYTGLYHTNWCQKERRSTFNDEWQLKWYVNLHNWNGISFHQYALPGYPDSHSCVRLAADDSEWIYRWCQSWTLAPNQRSVATEGTPVVIFGDYAWGTVPPWKRILDEPSGAQLSPEELHAAHAILREKAPPPLFPDPSLRPQNTGRPIPGNPGENH